MLLGTAARKLQQQYWLYITSVVQQVGFVTCDQEVVSSSPACAHGGVIYMPKVLTWAIPID